MANEQNLKPYEKGRSGNPNGRPRKLCNVIEDMPDYAQKRIYALLNHAIAARDKDEAAAVLQRGREDLPEYGFVLQLATRELLGKNGWKTLTDILDRLFGKPKIVAEASVTQTDFPEGMTKQEAIDYLAKMNK